MPNLDFCTERWTHISSCLTVVGVTCHPSQRVRLLCGLSVLRSV